MKQCKTCPWRVGADVHAIPHYQESLHRKLTSTIARPGDVSTLGGGQHLMACHYSTEGDDKVCVGWLANQLGPGNNLGLRLHVMRTPALQTFEVDGPQHARFEDTLPKRPRRRKAVSP